MVSNSKVVNKGVELRAGTESRGNTALHVVAVESQVVPEVGLEAAAVILEALANRGDAWVEVHNKVVVEAAVVILEALAKRGDDWVEVVVAVSLLEVVEFLVDVELELDVDVETCCCCCCCCCSGGCCGCCGAS